MAYQPVNHEAPPKAPDVNHDVQTPAAQQAANDGASAKALAEVHGVTPPAAGSEVKPTAADSLTSASSADANSGLTAAALSAWDKSSSAFSSWADSAGSALSSDFPGIASIFDTSAISPASLTDSSASPTAGFEGGLSALTGASASLDGQAGTGLVPSSPVDQVAVTHNAHTDTVTEADGVSYSRDNHTKTITEHGPDGTSTINHEGVDNNFAGAHFHRQLSGPVPNPSHVQPGEIVQGSNGVVYRSTTYSDNEGGGTVMAGTDGTLTIEGRDGDKLVLDANRRDVDWTPEGGQTQHMSYQQFRKEYGKTEFAGFHIDGNGQVTNRHDGVVVQAHQQEGTHPGYASVTKTNPNGGDVAIATVNSNGTSELRHEDALGGFLSDSRINYNDPSEAYQQFGQDGQLLANYNFDDDTFDGQGFVFNDNGMSAANVFFNDDGSTTASDSSLIDPSQSVYTGDGSLYADLSLSGTAPVGISTDEQADIASQLTDLSSMTPDQIATLEQMSGGRLNLDGALDHAEGREIRQGYRQEKQDRLASNVAPDSDVLDFAAAKDPYKQADIYAA